MAEPIASTSALPPPPTSPLSNGISPMSAATGTITPPSALPSFYKRPLPQSCIAFDSDEGKALFRKAMAEGNMENYFALAQSFLTQNEPAYCGLATLCMILNALGVDPQKQFKGPWRYYSQEMLDCCRTLDDVAASGITLAEFACLARCNGLHEHTRYGTMVSIEEFERDIERVCGRDDGTVMAISYSRKSLGQTGDGHFSPIAGYCKAEKRILVLDVARFKYPSYWVSLADLFKSLEPVDKATNQPRGYSVLRTIKPTKLRSDASHGPEAGLLSLNFNKHTWPDFLKGLPCIQPSQPVEVVSSIIKLLHSKQIHPLQSRKASRNDLEQAESQQMLDPVPTKLLSDAYDLQIRELVALVKASPTWRVVTESLQQNPSPLLHTSSYPQALEYILFLSSLLTSRSPPSPLRNAWRDLTSTDSTLSGIGNARIQQETTFIQHQMASLEKCCSTENACACAGKGLPGSSCQVIGN